MMILFWIVKKTTMTLLLYSYATHFLQYEMTCEFRPPHCNSCSIKQYPCHYIRFHQFWNPNIDISRIFFFWVDIKNWIKTESPIISSTLHRPLTPNTYLQLILSIILTWVWNTYAFFLKMPMSSKLTIFLILNYE